MKQGRLQFWFLAILTLVGGMISAPTGYAKAKADVEIAEQFDAKKQVNLRLLVAKKLPTFEIPKLAPQYFLAFLNSELVLQHIHNHQGTLLILHQEFEVALFQHLIYSPSQFKHFGLTKDSAVS